MNKKYDTATRAEWTAALAAPGDARCVQCGHTKLEHYAAGPVCQVCRCEGFFIMGNGPYVDALKLARVDADADQARAMRELATSLMDLGSTLSDAYRAVSTMVNAYKEPLVRLHPRTIFMCVVLTDPGWQHAQAVFKKGDSYGLFHKMSYNSHPSGSAYGWACNCGTSSKGWWASANERKVDAHAHLRKFHKQPKSCRNCCAKESVR